MMAKLVKSFLLVLQPAAKLLHNMFLPVVGYMYKFGVWDDQAPVLDPRLPVAIGSSVLSQEGVNGTVIANPPEWHHAEVGLNESGPGVVRGRVVACLQRFTQHSSASGKALHRSTYVQQTRLVRQVRLHD